VARSAASVSAVSSGWMSAVPRRGFMTTVRTRTPEQEAGAADATEYKEAPYIVVAAKSYDGPKKQSEILALQEKTPNFDPKELKTNLLRTLNLEEMYHRGKNREHPEFYPGSIVRVTYKESRTRPNTRRMVGIVISQVNRGLGSAFTIRNSIEGYAFEMEFQVFNPLIKNVEVLQLSRRRQAKLYYLRDRPIEESTFHQNMKAESPPRTKPNIIQGNK